MDDEEEEIIDTEDEGDDSESYAEDSFDDDEEIIDDSEEDLDSDDSDDFDDDEEIIEDSDSFDNNEEDYDEDDFEDPDAGLTSDDSDEFDWDDEDLAASLEPDELDDDELGFGEFNELAAQEGEDIFADPTDDYDSSYETSPGTEEFGLSPNAQMSHTPVTKEEKNEYFANGVLAFYNKLVNSPKKAANLLSKIFFKEGDN